MTRPASSPILLVASTADGHRQNYVAVLVRWFAGRGHPVVIASGPGDGGVPAFRTPILAQALSKSGAVAIDLEPEVIKDPTRFRARLTALEAEFDPVWTLLVNGEECISALRGAWPRTAPQRRRSANLIYFLWDYPVDLRPFPAWRKLRPWARHLRERYRQRRFIRREAWSALGLDLILSMDEHAVETIAHPCVQYLPEIYRAWGTDIGPEPAEIGPARQKFADFLRRHPGQDVLLYYGRRFMRRGYDTLLALAVTCKDTMFVDVGRNAASERLPGDVGTWRRELAAQGRLFELDLPFLPENALVDDLFRSAHYIVLPYRHWYGLSGILLQAVAAGLAVLVPDIGAMAYAVRRHGIGLTYRHLDAKHLRRQFDELRRDPGRFRDNALRFARQVDEEAVFAALTAHFGSE